MTETAPAAPPPDINTLTNEELVAQYGLGLQAVDITTGLRAEAIDATEKDISEKTTQKGFGGFLKKVWIGNIYRGVYRQKGIKRRTSESLAAGDIYHHHEGSTAEERQIAIADVLERFKDERVELHRGAGESNQEMDADYGTALKGLISEFVDDHIGLDSFVEAKNRLLSSYGAREHRRDVKAGLIYADNYAQVAVNAKLAVEHGLARDRVDALLGASRVGNAQMGARTEHRRDAVDKTVEKLHKVTGGGVNEGTLGIVCAAVMLGGKFTTRKAWQAAAIAGTMGVAAGAFAYGREYARVGEERQHHMREMAEGGEIPAGAERREEMEANRYESVHVDQLLDGLDGANEILASGDEGRILEALLQVTHADTRIKLSDEKKADLIQYSGKLKLESQRFDLDLKLAEAKVNLRHFLEGKTPEELTALGIGTSDVGELINQTGDTLREVIGVDMSDKDKAFGKLRKKRALKMAAIAFLAGETIGLALQEGAGAIESSLHSIWEGGPHGGRDTLLGAFTHNHHGGGSADHLNAQQIDATGGSVTHGVNPDGTAWHREFYSDGFGHKDVAVDIPDGYHLYQDIPNGKWYLADSHDKIVSDHLWFDKQGNLSAGQHDSAKDTMAQLRAQGFHLTQHKVNWDYTTHEQQMVPYTKTVHISAHEYMQRHPKDFVRFHRQLWYDNNTPGVYDQNELKEWWGGTNGNGLDANGNYVLNVSHMYPSGSFHGPETANAPGLLHEGKMALALSMSKDTQHYVQFFHFDQNGNTIIPKDSFAAHSLFQTVDGHARFTGAFAEAVQITGNNPDGSISGKMLATVVGENHVHGLTETVTGHQLKEVAVHHEGTHYVTNIELPHETTPPVEIPPVVPIYARRGLEPLATRDNPSPEEDVPYGYYGSVSPERIRLWETERSPRLRNNPEADLEIGEELAWYREELIRRRGREYVEELERNIANNPLLRSIGAETKALVCMPVEAVAEADNIYNTLSMYARQSDESKAATAIILNLNWQARAEADPDKLEKINRSRAEIERARRDFPDLRIGVFEKQWSDELLADRKAKLYGEVVKVLYDTAALAIERSIHNGQRVKSQEALLITNDADAQGLRRDYLDRYIAAFENNPTADIFNGAVRMGTSLYGEYPGYGVSTGFYAVMDMLTQRRENRHKGIISTPGANSAFRMSLFAAIGGSEDSPDLGAGADTILGKRAKAARLAHGAERKYRSLYGRLVGSVSSEASGSPSVGGPLAAGRMVTMHVNGAQIDTNGDRFLSAYRRGSPFIHAWGGFSTGGYEDRTSTAGRGSLINPENVNRDIDAITKRVEDNVIALAREWYGDRAVATSALALYFGSEDQTGNSIYQVVWDGEDNLRTFRFTAAGRERLRQMLSRDSRGRYDYYGSRLRRKLYSELPAGSTRTPLAVPRFIGA